MADNATRREKTFNNSQAQGKAEIKPNDVGHDLRRKTMAAIKGAFFFAHYPKIGQKPFKPLT